MRYSSLIQALLFWRCLQWRNARLYSVLFDVVPCYWKSLCKIPRAQNSWRYESVVLTNRIARKRMNIKKIKLSISDLIFSHLSPVTLMVGTPQIKLQQYLVTFPFLSLPSGNLPTSLLLILWWCLPISSFFPIPCKIVFALPDDRDVTIPSLFLLLHYDKSHVARKPVFGVFYQVRHKPACTAKDAR